MFLKEVSHAHKGFIYLNKNEIKTAILLKMQTFEDRFQGVFT